MKSKIYKSLLLALLAPLALIAQVSAPFIATNGELADNTFLQRTNGPKNLFTGLEGINDKEVTAKGLFFIENKGQVTDQNDKPRTDIQFALSATVGLNVFVVLALYTTSSANVMTLIRWRKTLSRQLAGR